MTQQVQDRETWIENRVREMKREAWIQNRMEQLRSDAGGGSANIYDQPDEAVLEEAPPVESGAMSRFGRGAAETFVGAPGAAVEGLGVLFGSEGMQEAGKAIQPEFLDPAERDTTAAKLGSVLGSGASMMIPGGAAGVAGRAVGVAGKGLTALRAGTVATQATLTAMPDAFYEAKANGASDDRAWWSALVSSAGQGGLEIFGPQGKLLDKLVDGVSFADKATGGMGKALLTSTLQEAGEEGVQSLFGDVVAQRLFDVAPDEDWATILGNAAKQVPYGAFGGFVLGGAAIAAQKIVAENAPKEPDPDRTPPVYDPVERELTPEETTAVERHAQARGATEWDVVERPEMAQATELLRKAGRTVLFVRDNGSGSVEASDEADAGVTILPADADEATVGLTVATHEALHALPAPEREALVETLKTSKTTKSAHAAKRAGYAERAKAEGVKVEDLDEEGAADLAGALAPVVQKVMRNPAAALKLTTERPNVLVRVLDAVGKVFGRSTRAEMIEKELTEIADVRDVVAKGMTARQRIQVAHRIVTAFGRIETAMKRPVKPKPKPHAEPIGPEQVPEATVQEARGDDVPVDPQLGQFANRDAEQEPERTAPPTLLQSLQTRSAAARERAAAKEARAVVVESRPGAGKAARKRAKHLRNQAKMLNDGAASMEKHAKSIEFEQRDRKEPKNPGDRVRFEDGSEGVVSASFDNGTIRVRVPRKPGKGESAEDAARVITETISVPASSVMRVGAVEAAQPKAEQKQQDGDVAAPVKPRAVSVGNVAAKVVKELKSLASRQTHYMGHKSDFFKKVAEWLGPRLDLRGVKTIFDMYAGGGTYGLSFAVSGAAPDVKRVVINEVDKTRKHKFDVASRHGEDVIDPWDTSPLLIELRNVIDGLVADNDSVSPAALAIDTITGDSKPSDKYEQFVKFRARYAALSMDEKAALLAVRDVMFSGRTATVAKLFENAAQDANNVQFLVKKAKRLGISVEVVSMDAVGPEAVQMVRKAGRSFVVLDPPYHGTASGNYSAGGVEYDFKSPEFLRMNLEAAKQMSPGNAVLYNNAGDETVRKSALAAFGPKLETLDWTRKKVGAAPAQQEFLGVVDYGQSQGLRSGGVVGGSAASAQTGAAGEQRGVLGAARGDGRGSAGAGSVGSAGGAQGGVAGAGAKYSLRDTLGFYSRLDETVEKLPVKLSGLSAISKLRAQANAEELQYSGVLDFLKGKQQVTRDEILAYLETHGVTLKESVLTDAAGPWTEPDDVGVHVLDPDEDETREHGDEVVYQVEVENGETYSFVGHVGKPGFEVIDPNGNTIGNVRNQIGAERVIQGHVFQSVLDQADGPAEHASYQLPGGENYREMLLTLPYKQNVESFTSSHFGDHPNIVVHMRVNDRVQGTHDARRKTLFVEEIQSDWHQKGRELGYAEPQDGEIAQRRLQLMKKLDRMTIDLAKKHGMSMPVPSPSYVYHRLTNRSDHPDAADDLRSLGSLQNEYAAVNQAWLDTHGRVPDAPFKETWATLAMKRLFVHAARNGYDQIAWTTGAQQIDRYEEQMRQNIDKLVSEPASGALKTALPPMAVVEVDYNPDTDESGGPWSVEVRPEGEPAFITAYADSEREAEAIMEALERKRTQADDVRKSSVYVEGSKEGRNRFGAEVPLNGTTRLHGHDVTLEDVVGKEIAKKIRAAPGETHIFEGDGLSIGGKGMQAFYDKALPDIAKKLTKQEPTMIEIPTGPRTHAKVHAVRVPETAKAGFARFSLRSNIESEAQSLASEDPDGYQLANAGASMPERVMRAAVRSMNPVERKSAAQSAIEVQAILDDRSAREKVMRRAQAGEALNDIEVVVVDRMARLMGINAWRRGSSMENAVDAELAYQGQRTMQGRALGSPLLRDSMYTPAERMMKLMLSPSVRVRRAYAKAKTAAQRRAIIEAEAAKVERIRYSLEQRGIDPALISDEALKDAGIAKAYATATVNAKAGGAYDWYVQWRRASLLSGPITFTRNATGNTSYVTYDRMARIFADALVPGSDTTFADAKQYARDIFSGMGQGWDDGAAGYRDFYASSTEGTSLDEQDIHRRGAILTAVESVGVRAQSAADIMFRSIVGNAETRLRARQKARTEGGVAEDYIHDPDVLAMSKEDTERALFLDRDGITRAVSGMRDWADTYAPIGTTILPFASTPTKLIQRGGEALLGPLSGFFRERERGGSIALGLGAWAAMVWAASMFDDEDDLPFITGSRDRGGEGDFQDRAVPAYSIRIGGAYYSYQQIEPIATALAAVVDGVRDGTVMSSVSGFMTAAKDKSFFRSVQVVYDAVQAAKDGEERGNDRALRAARDLLWTPMIPNIIRSPLRATDEDRRKEIGAPLEVQDFMNAAIPYGEYGPPLKHDLWGRTIEKDGGTWVARVLAPLMETEEVADIERIDLLLSKTDKFFSAPSLFVTRNGEKRYWTEDEYAELSRDAGASALAILRPWAERRTELNERDLKHISEVLSKTRARKVKELLRRNP